MRPKTVHKRLKQRVRHIESVWGRGRMVRLGAVLLMTVSLLIPTLSELHQQQMYMLDASTIRLVGKANKNLVKKFSYDAQQSIWQFNKAGMKPDLSNLKNPNEVAAQLKAQVGGGGKEDASLYSVDLPTDATQGVTYYDNNTNLSFSLIPQFKVSDGQERDGRLVYPFQDGGKLVYTAMNNGMKEDIVLSHNIGDELQFSYKLNLPKTLEARLLDDGSLGIYSADPALFGNITYGSDADQAKIERARQTATKDHLLFALPAPVVKQTGSNTNTATAHFALQDNELFVSAKGLSKLSYPVTIDPSVVVTSSSDFSAGNNEGNIDFNTGQISRGGLTGGSAVAGWTPGTSFLNGRYGHQVVTYNGYLYVLGGYTNTGNMYFSDVQYAPLNSDGSVGSWLPTKNFSVARQYHTAVAYNGYMYVMGGWNGSTYYSDVQYAPINSDGTLGSWSYTKALTSARRGHTAVAYNGYMYVMGGYTGSLLNTVQYAAIHGDGTLGDWTTTNSFANGRNSHTSAAYNGYLYILGGWPGSYTNDVQYAHINSDGSIDPWKTTTSLPTVIANHATAVYNGYIYVTGGTNNGSTYFKTVYYAQINANGTLGSWVRTTDLPAARDLHAMVSYNGYLYIAGGLGADYFADSLYAKIDPLGATSGYTSTTAFATPRYGHTTVAYNGYLYVLGGNNGAKKFNLLSDVQYAPINPDGTIGTWQTTASFPTARYFHNSVAYNGYIYVLGGWNGSYLSDVQYAPINPDGTIGTWTPTASFTNARFNPATVTYNGYIYLLGGTGASGFLNDVQYAPINPDGTIGTWTPANNFSTPRDSFTAVTYNGYLYIVGGVTTGSVPLNDVQYAPINPDGTIGTWTPANNFSTPRWGHTSVAYDGYLYILGGYNGSSYFSDVQYARINTDGTIGTWTVTNSIAAVRYYHTTVVYNGYMYVLGGMGAFYYSTVEYAQIGSGGSGTTGSWAITTSFTTARSGHTTVAYNGYLYILGGYDGSTRRNDVQYAPINPDGTIGTWQTTTSFTTGRDSHTSVAYNGYLYILGGYDGSTRRNDVQYAPINPDGTIGTWQTTTSFTTGRDSHTSVAYNGYLYILGGYVGGSNGALNDVQYAPINPDGTIGTWQTTTSIDYRYGHTSVAYNGYLYVIGGYTDGLPPRLNDVQYAPINPDGTIGTWQTTTSFIATRGGLTSVVYNGHLYVLGGSNSGFLNDVQYAPINPDGTIGTWQTTTSFTTGRSGHTSVVYNGYLYVLGGKSSGGSLTDVQYAPLNVIARVGHYSKLIDLGTESLLGGITYNGTLPGGAKSIVYRTASSDGIFGASATIDTIVGSGDGQACGGSSGGTVRYIWISVTIDDSAEEVVFPNITGTASNLTDITVNYTPNNNGRASPDKRLHNGKFFKNEALQPLDTCIE